MSATTFALFVPSDPASTTIAPGSAIVAAIGSPPAGERLLVYYEGNLNGAQNIKTYEDRAMLAADRLSVCYPTVAMAALLPEELIEVGRYHLPTRRIVALSNPAVLRTWIPGEVELIEARLREVG